RWPKPEKGWREANVIAGAEWRRLSTNLISELAPKTPLHAAYYQAFLADGVLYRDAQGVPHFTPRHDEPKDAIVERQFSVEETLEAIARVVDEHLGSTRTNESLFLLMPPESDHVTKPLLVDRQQRRCVCLAPAALYDSSEQGFTL